MIKTYKQLQESMPKDTLSKQWLTILKQQPVVYIDKYFIGVTSWKHYNLKICTTCRNAWKNHYVFFSIRPICNITDLKRIELDDMYTIHNHFKSGLFINTNINKTVARFHFHLFFNSKIS